MPFFCQILLPGAIEFCRNRIDLPFPGVVFKVCKNEFDRIVKNVIIAAYDPTAIVGSKWLGHKH